MSEKIEIAIVDRKATIAIAIGDLFSNGDRDRDRDLIFDEDRDRDRDHNFRDRTNTLDEDNNQDQNRDEISILPIEITQPPLKESAWSALFSNLSNFALDNLDNYIVISEALQAPSLEEFF